MATIKLTVSDWVEQLASVHKNSNEYKKLNGYSPNYAGGRLNISKQMVSRLIKNDKLTQINLMDDQGGRVGILITSFSIEQYERNRMQYAQNMKKQQQFDL